MSDELKKYLVRYKYLRAGEWYNDEMDIDAWDEGDAAETVLRIENYHERTVILSVRRIG